MFGETRPGDVQDRNFAGNPCIDPTGYLIVIIARIFRRNQGVPGTEKEVRKPAVCFFSPRSYKCGVLTSCFRLTYDAALSKVERLKGSKKEKDREEADDELEVAKTRLYVTLTTCSMHMLNLCFSEDVTEDVRVRMQSIQENEIGQVRDLGSFLDTEIRYAENYLEVMKDVKAGWSKE